MIKSLTAKNILSHKKTYMEFHPGVNMIIGPTNEGKSALFHELYWPCFNRPLGDPHRSHWGGVMESTIELWEGPTIQLKRDKQNIYTIDRKDGTDPTVFKAFGTDPPPEVISLLNLDKKINVQEQLERSAPIFLISETPGEVARFFNKVAGLYQIDKVISTGKSDIKKVENLLNNNKEQLKEKKDTLKQFKGLSKLKVKIDKAESIELGILSDTALKNKLENQVNKCINIIRTIQKSKAKTKSIKKIKIALKIWNNIETGNNEIFNLETKLEKVLSCEKEIKKLKDKLKPEPLIDRALTVSNSISFYNKEMRNIKGVLSGIKGRKNKIQELIIQKGQSTVKFDALMPQECPLCNNIRRG